MIAAGEIEIAMDELRWLLDGCPEFLDAHVILGELAAADNDISLARAHFGIAYQLGTKEIRRVAPSGPLPYSLPGNQRFFQAGKGLIWCLEKLKKSDMAREVAAMLLRFDASDPLNIARLQDS